MRRKHRKRGMPAALKAYWAKQRSPKKSRRVHSSMARRRSRRAYSRSSGGKWSKGIFPVSGLIAGLLVGAGVATLQEKFLPQVIPYQGAAAGFAVGGIAGAGGALLRDMFKGATIPAGQAIY